MIRAVDIWGTTVTIPVFQFGPDPVGGVEPAPVSLHGAGPLRSRPTTPPSQTRDSRPRHPQDCVPATTVSTAIGKCLAEWILEGKPRTVDLTPFRAARFAEGRPWVDDDNYGRERLTISR
jgi:hypothetical protein